MTDVGGARNKPNALQAVEQAVRGESALIYIIFSVV